MTDPKVKNVMLLVARILLGALFVYTGYAKLVDISGVASFAQMPEWQIMVAGLVELVGGALVILGGCVHLGALALAIYLIVVQVMFHLPLTDDVMNTIQFFKNASILGGLLLLMVCGGGQHQIYKCKCDKQ